MSGAVDYLAENNVSSVRRQRTGHSSLRRKSISSRPVERPKIPHNNSADADASDTSSGSDDAGHHHNHHHHHHHAHHQHARANKTRKPKEKSDGGPSPSQTFAFFQEDAAQQLLSPRSPRMAGFSKGGLRRQPSSIGKGGPRTPPSSKSTHNTPEKSRPKAGSGSGRVGRSKDGTESNSPEPSGKSPEELSKEASGGGALKHSFSRKVRSFQRQKTASLDQELNSLDIGLGKIDMEPMEGLGFVKGMEMDGIAGVDGEAESAALTVADVEVITDTSLIPDATEEEEEADNVPDLFQPEKKAFPRAASEQCPVLLKMKTQATRNSNSDTALTRLLGLQASKDEGAQGEGRRKEETMEGPEEGRKEEDGAQQLFGKTKTLQGLKSQKGVAGAMLSERVAQFFAEGEKHQQEGAGEKGEEKLKAPPGGGSFSRARTMSTNSGLRPSAPERRASMRQTAITEEIVEEEEEPERSPAGGSAGHGGRADKSDRAPRNSSSPFRSSRSVSAELSEDSAGSFRQSDESSERGINGSGGKPPRSNVSPLRGSRLASAAAAEADGPTFGDDGSNAVLKPSPKGGPSPLGRDPSKSAAGDPGHTAGKPPLGFPRMHQELAPVQEDELEAGEGRESGEEEGEGEVGKEPDRHGGRGGDGHAGEHPEGGAFPHSTSQDSSRGGGGYKKSTTERKLRSRPSSAGKPLGASRRERGVESVRREKGEGGLGVSRREGEPLQRSLKQKTLKKDPSFVDKEFDSILDEFMKNPQGRRTRLRSRTPGTKTPLGAEPEEGGGDQPGGAHVQHGHAPGAWSGRFRLLRGMSMALDRVRERGSDDDGADDEGAEDHDHGHQNHGTSAGAGAGAGAHSSWEKLRKAVTRNKSRDEAASIGNEGGQESFSLRPSSTNS